MAMPKRIGPLAAMALMEAFLLKQWELNEDEADALFDVVIDTLSKVRDERYRFLKSPGASEE